MADGVSRSGGVQGLHLVFVFSGYAGHLVLVSLCQEGERPSDFYSQKFLGLFQENMQSKLVS